MQCDATTDERLMTLALEQAHAALSAGEVAVGAVFVEAATGAVLIGAHNRTTRDCNVRTVNAQGDVARSMHRRLQCLQLTAAPPC